jgi:hypothetical protein
MVTTPSPLNKKQVEVLEWIRKGCPEGIYATGYQHRIIARALERRGLIAISGRGPTWNAAVTESGQVWRNAPSEDALPAEVDADSVIGQARGGVLPVETEADKLIGQVLKTGGRLILPQDRDVEKAHERLVHLSLKSPARPKGKRLQIIPTGTWGHGPKAVSFTEHFDDYVEARPVPVPERIARYHPAVKAFIADKEWQYVTDEHVPRAGRILQAIATEAEKRGIDAMRPEDSAKDGKDHRMQYVTKGHLALRRPTGLYTIQIKEIPRPGARKTEKRRWNERKTKPAWIENRGWEFTSTGKLELIADGPGTAYNGNHYRDAKSATLEDKLPEVFRSFEIHRLRADWQEQQRQREKADRRHRWEAAMASAKEQYFEDARWEHFTERSRSWAAINQHRDFLNAAKNAAESNNYTGNKDAILQHLDHAERTLDALDPIRQLSKLVPEVPDPKPDDLKPFLGGWSPHGPDSSHR